MWGKLLLTVIAAALFIPFIISKPMYTLVHERAELLDYNASLAAKDILFSFSKVNRTSFAFNASFTLLRDVTDRKVMVDVGVDKLYGNEYRRTPTSITVNVCKLWQKNMFGMRDEIKKHGNMEACDIYKGKYYLINFVPDENMFPPVLPLGSYRIDINVRHGDDIKLFRMFWFSRVEPLVKQG